MFFTTVQGTGGNTAQAQVSIPSASGQRRLIVATAHARAHYSGPTKNAGIVLTIECSGTNEKVQDDSFEGESSNIGFHASATQMFQLDAGFTGWVKAIVTPYGAGGQNNTGSTVTLSVAAFAAP